MKWLIIAVGAVALLVAIVAVIGLLLPKAHVARAERHVDAPAADVWTVLTTVRDYGAWRSDVKNVDVLAPAGGAERWKESGKNGDITFEVKEAQPESRLVVRIADEKLPFGGTWTYELRPDASGTQITVTENGEVYNPIFRFVSHFFMSQTATMERFLADLDARLRAGSRV